jgi:hypothetical protein
MFPDQVILHSRHRGEETASLLRSSCARLVMPVPFRPTLQHRRRGHLDAKASGTVKPHRRFGTCGHQSRDRESRWKTNRPLAPRLIRSR